MLISQINKLLKSNVISYNIGNHGKTACHLFYIIHRKIFRNFTVMMKTRNIILILTIILTVALTACRNSESELQRLDAEANGFMSTYSKEGLDSLGNLMLEKARRSGNKKYEAKAHFYLSYFTPDLTEKEIAAKLRHLNTAERIADEIQNDTLLLYIYNQRGVYEISTSYTAATAQYWFTRSIEKAAGLKDRKYSIPAEMNMSEACRFNGDTIGIRYDKDLFEYAKTTDNNNLKFLAGLHCAVYYAATVSDTAELRPYIDAMRPMSKEYPGAVEMVYAKFFMNNGNYVEAERFMRLSQPDNYADFSILYADILNHLGRYRESDLWAEKAIPSRYSVNFNDYGRLLRLRADNMAALGYHEEAFSRQKEYEAFRDSVSELKNLDLSKRYKAEFNVVIKDREISEQKMRIRNMSLMISAIILFVIFAAVAYYLWHRRRNRFYHDIVRQNREFIERQNIMSERLARRDARIQELEASLTDNSGRQSKISDEKANEIFDRIQNLADDKQVWRDVNITREAFADMVGCNRSYFSEVLKSKTGMSYSQFMNSCRIREAVKVLSDPNDTTPLKDLSAALGFLTIQTFYSAFRQNIGMSPNAFRKAAVDNGRQGDAGA